MTTTDTDAPELLPCPFCGSNCIVATPYEGGGACVRCGADCDEWNRRADLAKPRVKPLVWTKSHGHGKGLEIISHSLIGRYLVQWTESECHAIFPGGDWRSFGCKKAAKAAADAHHTAHVLAQLEGE